MYWRKPGLIAFAGIAILEYHPILYMGFGLVLLVFAFVILPAIWSVRLARRQAASGVLCQLLVVVARRPDSLCEKNVQNDRTEGKPTRGY
jgi:hypothetical protein